MNAPDYEALLAELRRTHVLVREDDEWIAYRPGRFSRWGQWRAIKMLGGLGDERVGVEPTVRTPEPHPDTVGCPDTFPKDWAPEPPGPKLPPWDTYRPREES